MKNIKKYVLLLLCLLFVFVAACSNASNNEPSIPDDEGDTNNNGNDTPAVPDEPVTPNEPTTPNEPSNHDTPTTPDTPADPGAPDEPAAQTWREKVTDSGYGGAKLIQKVGDKTSQLTFGKTFADEMNYIAGLTDPKQSNGPSSYSDHTAFSIAFDDPSGNNYGIDFIRVVKNGTTYLAVKEDKENTRWLTADAVTYLEEVFKDNNIKLG